MRLEPWRIAALAVVTTHFEVLAACGSPSPPPPPEPSSSSSSSSSTTSSSSLSSELDGGKDATTDGEADGDTDGEADANRDATVLDVIEPDVIDGTPDASDADGEATTCTVKDPCGGCTTATGGSTACVTPPTTCELTPGSCIPSSGECSYILEPNCDAGPDAADASDGSSEASANSATGTIGGQELIIQSAFAGNVPVGNPGLAPDTNVTSIVLSNVSIANLADLCALNPDGGPGNAWTEDDSGPSPNQTVLYLDIVTNSSLTPGTFDVLTSAGATIGAGAFYGAAYDQSDNPTACEQSVSGTVTVSTVTASEIIGTFDLNLSPWNAQNIINTVKVDHVTGAFSAAICASYSATGANPPNSAECQ